jgi:hypothetical protein
VSGPDAARERYRPPLTDLDEAKRLAAEVSAGEPGEMI